jgi:hypothetical protein
LTWLLASTDHRRERLVERGGGGIRRRRARPEHGAVEVRPAGHRGDFPDKASSDHAPTSELSARPSTSRWFVDHATVKPPHEKDTT